MWKTVRKATLVGLLLCGIGLAACTDDGGGETSFRNLGKRDASHLGSQSAQSAK
jgi:hypothetical protein